MKRTILILCLMAGNSLLHAQQDSSRKFTFSGYGEFYWGYDAAAPADHLRPGFVYNHKRHNEVNINLVMLKAAFAQPGYRANFALMAGNYAQYNLAAEPEFARFIYEANAGVKLSKKKEIWLDAGIFPSHIGFESAVGADSWTLTRSLAAENSPYYETGIRLSAASANGKLSSSFMLLNGWQKVQRPDGMNRPALGLQLNYKASDRLTLNYSNFFGSDKPDSLDAWRFFNNFHAVYEKGKFGLTAGFDIGSDRSSTGRYAIWFTPTLIARFKVTSSNIIALRAEYFSDSRQLLVNTGTPNGFKTFGASLNHDLSIGKYLLWRTEAKFYHAADKIFTKGNAVQNSNLAFCTALCVRF